MLRIATAILVFALIVFRGTSFSQIAPRRPIPTTGQSTILSSTSGRTGYVPPKSYSDYYSRSLQKYHRPPASARDYTIDKHFYHRPTISPYLNLTRRPSQYGMNNYQQYVRPELDRRAQTQMPSRRPLSSSFSPYYNQFYGSR